MTGLLQPVANDPPHIVRLSTLATLSSDEIDLLRSAGRTARTVAARRELISEGAIEAPGILVSGWAARIRDFRDGRRQILQVLMPGDLLSSPDSVQAPSPAACVALTPVTLISAPAAPSPESGLARAYRRCLAYEQGCLFRHIARLGRLDAAERLTDLLLEFRDRAELAGLGGRADFPLPITQEALADTLGLTSVHVNRTLQLLRRDGLLKWAGGAVQLLEPARLAASIGYRAVTI